MEQKKFEQNNGENLPNLMKDNNLQIQEMLQTTCRIAITVVITTTTTTMTTATVNAHHRKSARKQ